MRKWWIVVAVIVAFGCGPGSSSYIYSSIKSPSGQLRAVKQYAGDDEIYWDVLIMKRGALGDHAIAVLQHQSSSREDTYGSDGVIMSWDGDHQLTLGWPAGEPPLSGPSELGGITLKYRAFEPDLDRADEAARRESLLRNVVLDFREIDSAFGAKYASTGQPIPRISCVVRISGNDPINSEIVTVEITGNGIGRSGDNFLSFGGVSVAFSRTSKEGGRSVLTQARFGSGLASFPSNGAPKQSDDSLLYRNYNLHEALALFSDIRSGTFSVKLSSDFGKSVSTYRIELLAAATTSEVISKFNECAAGTNVYGGNFHVPIH